MRFLRRALVVYVLVLVCTVATIYLTEVETFRRTLDVFNKSVIMGNEYATSSMQDVESFSKIINIRDNPLGLQQYHRWLYCMGNNRNFKIDRNDIMYDTAGITTDKTFKLFNQFLTNDAKRTDKVVEHYSPLDFGITYLDKAQLEKDMYEYLILSVTELERFKATSNFKGYNIDPDSIRVESEINVKPINISKEDDYIKYIFGAKKAQVLGNIAMSECNTLVVYDITYFITFDYIPKTSFFTISVKDRGKYDQDELVYEYNIRQDDGKLVPSGRTKLKWQTQDALQYQFRYIMTH